MSKRGSHWAEVVHAARQRPGRRSGEMDNQDPIGTRRGRLVTGEDARKRVGKGSRRQPIVLAPPQILPMSPEQYDRAVELLATLLTDYLSAAGDGQKHLADASEANLTDPS
jgi:hypothetical protein